MKCHVCNCNNKASQKYCTNCGTPFGSLKKSKNRSLVTTATIGFFIVAAACSVTNNHCMEKADVDKQMIIDSCYGINQEVYKKLDFQTEVIKDFEAEFKKIEDEKKVLSSKAVEKSDRGDEDKPYLVCKSLITSEQLDKFLSKSNLKGLGASFKAAEQEYDINAIFLAAVAIHESGWGNNKISQQKNNIMSICAYDWSPVSSAKSYKTKTDCILRGAELLKRDYLTPKGKYFHGATLEGVNKSYATDIGWSSKVRNYIRQMERLVKA